MDSWAPHQERNLAQRPRRNAPATATASGNLPVVVVQAGQSAGTANVHATTSTMPTALPPRPARRDRGAPGQPPQVNSNVSHSDLLHATALLSLETARKVRLLSSVTTRTIFIPDTAALGTPMRALAARDRSYHETEHAYAWAQLILATLEHAADSMPAAAREALRNHAAATPNADSLLDDVLQCVVVRCHAGDGCNLILAVSPQLQPLATILTRVLVCAGCSVRFGPAPRGRHERAVAAALRTS